MIVNVDHENFHDEVYHHDGPVVVTFGFSGCAPCRSLAVELEKLNKQDGVKVVKVDIGESGEIATHFNVNSVPTQAAGALVTQFAVPSIAARAGNIPALNRDGTIAMDRDRRAQYRDVLSRGPVRARSAGDFAVHDAPQNTASGA